MRLTLVITTYERPDALNAVLATVAAQQRLPDEVIVADDGSGASTAAVVQRWQAALPVPLLHRWQEKRGFRLTRLRNLAIAAASGDYLVFIDGDMLLHRCFIADHERLARSGHFTQGVRVLLDQAATDTALHAPTRAVGLLTRGLGGLRRLYVIRSAWLSRLLRDAGNHLISIKGCNQAFWRNDLLRVNGFDEAIEGWGPEDKELCARLQHSGIARQSLLAGGIACHLHHAPAARDAQQRNTLVLAQTIATRRSRCERGVDAHLTAGKTPPPTTTV